MKQTFKQFLIEEKQDRVALSDMLSSTEQKQVEQLVKDNNPTSEMEKKVSQRIEKMGKNAALNIGTFLKFVQALKKKHHPEKFKAAKGSGVGYGKSREEEMKRRRKEGRDAWTGD